MVRLRSKSALDLTASGGSGTEAAAAVAPGTDTPTADVIGRAATVCAESGRGRITISMATKPMIRPTTAVDARLDRKDFPKSIPAKARVRRLNLRP